MREFDAIPEYPAAPRVANRTIHNRIAACYRDKEFYDGNRMNGYGGMVNDGRWGAVADNLIKVYGLKDESYILQIGCHKGFLLEEFLNRGISAVGTEVSKYAKEQATHRAQGFIRTCPPFRLPYGDKEFDFVLCVQPVYALVLYDAICCLREIERVGRGKSFITLGAYETDLDYKLMQRWCILGNLILTKDEWITVMNHAGFSGDFRFDTPQTLGLVEG